MVDTLGVMDQNGKPTGTKSVSYKVAMLFFLANMAWTLLNRVNTTQFNFFLTDVAMVSTVLMAIITVTGSAFEYAGVFLASILVEKCNFRAGKYRTWLLIAPPITTLFFVLMFCAVPIENDMAKAVYYAMTYGIATGSVCFYITAQNAMITLIGKKDPADRALLSTKRGQGSQLGQFLWGIIGIPCLLFIAGGDQHNWIGYAGSALLWGAFLIFFYWRVYKGVPKDIEHTMTEEEFQAQKAINKEKHDVSIVEMFVILFKNLPYLGFLIADSCRYTAQTVFYGLAVYIFTYYFNDKASYAVMMSTITLFALAATFINEVLIRFFSNRTLYLAGLLVYAAGFALACFFGTSPVLFTAFICISWFGNGVCNSSNCSLSGDAILYYKWKTGKDTTGFLNGMSAGAPKIASFVASFFKGFGMVAVGYVAGGDLSANALSGMVNLTTLMPAGILLFGFLCLFFMNKLNGQKMKEINAELNERDEAEAAEIAAIAAAQQE